MTDYELATRQMHLIDVSRRIVEKLGRLGDTAWDESERVRLSRVLDIYVYPELKELSRKIGAVARSREAARQGMSKALAFVSSLLSIYTRRRKIGPLLLEHQVPLSLDSGMEVR